ncbi:cysteine desulfurase [Candidatus Bipolaricaulota bacterium]|nr:cysteine desulfurase [Candidatus Bipolaricaulota bacterium]
MDPNTTYFDNWAASRLDERVLEAMKPLWFDRYAVATSEFGYSLGIEARDALEAARGSIAETLKADRSELVFTSGSTEASNLAIQGVWRASRVPQEKTHLVVSAVEDFPVLHVARALEHEGVSVTYLPVDEDGRVDPEMVRRSLRENTLLVSIQAVNQEIGSLQPIETIAEVCREAGVLFHTDASYAHPRVPIDVASMPIDLATISPHRIHGPKGIGALYVREGTSLRKVLEGGFQEQNLRPGSEDIASAVGFATAVDLANEEETEHLRSLRDQAMELLLSVPHSRLNGHPRMRAPDNANISFRFVEGESLLLHLDMRGIAVSTGSACFSRSLEASHVILAAGGDHERAHGSVRVTLGRFNTAAAVAALAESIGDVVSELRRISPLGKGNDDADSL